MARASATLAYCLRQKPLAGTAPGTSTPRPHHVAVVAEASVGAESAAPSTAPSLGLVASTSCPPSPLAVPAVPPTSGCALPSLAPPAAPLASGAAPALPPLEPAPPSGPNVAEPPPQPTKAPTDPTPRSTATGNIRLMGT
jgi:hypothetical protein